MKNGTTVAMAVLLAAVGCRRGPKGGDEFYLQPLAVQQSRAYAETVTGRFVSLADFEDCALTHRPGHSQINHFSIAPAGAGGRRKFVVNITRTGAGAMEVAMPGGASLVYRMPQVHDFSQYTLLMLAIYSRNIRDDLTIRISTDRAGWESLPVLLRRGWNNVPIDLQRLKAKADFDARGVRSIRLWFSAAAAGAKPVRINVDDIMLIDNRREISPLPKGMRLVKNGLDYVLYLPHRPRPVRISQCDDGLWRLGPDQAVMELGAGAGNTPPREDLPTGQAGLAVMGRRRVGEVEVLENNAICLRLANTWYFPTSAGEWLSLAVRRIRWEYTFYRDGRWITDVLLNNAGGETISAVRITTPAAAVFSDGLSRAGSRGLRGRVKEVRPFAGPAGRWSFIITPQTPRREMYEANFIKPGRLEIRMGSYDEAGSDTDGDGFDQSQGCYRARARASHCRFMLVPAGGAIADAIVRVAGKWNSTVTASSEGLVLRELVRLSDGSVIFVLPGVTDRPRWVEVTGSVPPGGR